VGTAITSVASLSPLAFRPPWGWGIGLARKRAALRSVAVAIAGDIFLPGLMILALIWFFVGAGHCLD
jgi:hypothetical protein